MLVAGFMSVIGITALMLAALVQERARAQSGQRRDSEARFRAFMQHLAGHRVHEDGRRPLRLRQRRLGGASSAEPADLLGQTRLRPLAEGNRRAASSESDQQGADARAARSRSPSPGPATTASHAVVDDAEVPRRAETAARRSSAASPSTSRRACAPSRRFAPAKTATARWSNWPAASSSSSDADGRIIEFNREAEAFFGLSREPTRSVAATVDCCVPEPHRVAGAERLRAHSRRRVAAGPRVGVRPARRHAQVVSVERHAAHRRQRREPAAAGHRPGHLGAAAARAPAAAVAAHGRHRPAGRRHRPRLQQPADGDSRPRRDGAGRRRAEGDPAQRQHRRDHARRAASRRPHAAAAGVCPAADHRAADRRSQRPGAERRPHAAAAARRGRRAGDRAGSRTSGACASTRASSSRCW